MNIFVAWHVILKHCFHPIKLFNQIGQHSAIFQIIIYKYFKYNKRKNNIKKLYEYSTQLTPCFQIVIITSTVIT